MNSSNIEARLSQLVNKITGDGKELSSAEIAAYAQVIAELYDELNNTLDGAFVSLADDSMVELYCRELGIPLSLSNDERRQRVVAAMKKGSTPFDRSAFDEMLDEVVPGATYTVDNFTLTLEISRKEWTLFMQRIINTLDKFVPAGVTIRGVGNGLDWRNWDKLGKKVGELDIMTAPFYLFATI